MFFIMLGTILGAILSPLVLGMSVHTAGSVLYGQLSMLALMYVFDHVKL